MMRLIECVVCLRVCVWAMAQHMHTTLATDIDKQWIDFDFDVDFGFDECAIKMNRSTKLFDSNEKRNC